MRTTIRYVVEDVDRFGNVRLYYRRTGFRKVRLRGPSGSVSFWEDYRAADAAHRNGGAAVAPKVDISLRPGTWRWLCIRYFSECAEFLDLGPTTQPVRRRALEATFDEKIAPESETTYGQVLASSLTVAAIVTLRNNKRRTKGMANDRLKAIRGVFAWAVLAYPQYVKANVARDVPYFKIISPGHHSWTVAEVRQFESRHPVGSRARLALGLLLWTGVRRSDVVRLGPPHVDGDGWLCFIAAKNARRKPVQVEIPIITPLADLLAKSPVGKQAFLETSFGKPFTPNGFTNWFLERCREAELPAGCSAHGLRKAGATTAAENGATAHQLMAIFGWMTLQQAERYTRAAERRRMAGAGMEHIQINEASVPHSTTLDETGA